MALTVSSQSELVVEPSSRMSIAARDGDLQTLQDVIDDGVDMNAVDPSSGSPPLHYAVKYGRKSCVELLLNHCEVDKTNSIGVTALQIAISSLQDTDIVKPLLDHGAVVIDRSARLSAFHLACEYGDKEVIELIFNERREELISENKWLLSCGKVPHLHSRSNQVLKLLFEIDERCGFEFDVDDKQKCTVLSIAAGGESGDPDLLARYLERFGDSILKTPYAFKVLRSAGCSIDCVQFLLEHGCVPYEIDPKTGNVSLTVVGQIMDSINRSTSLRDLILSSITPDVVCNFEAWQKDIVLTLHCTLAHPLQAVISTISYLPAVSETGFSLCNVLSAFLRNGFDPNILKYSFSSHVIDHPDHFFRCLNMLKCYMDHCHNIITQAILTVLNDFALKQIVSILVKFGVSVNASSNRSVSPLMALAFRKPSHFTMDILSLLLSAGADLNYHRVTSSFQCADVAVAAALSGNTVLLPLIVTSIGLDSTLLLADLLKIELVFRTDTTQSQVTSSFQAMEIMDHLSAIRTIGTNQLSRQTEMYMSSIYNNYNPRNNSNELEAQVLLEVRPRVASSIISLLKYMNKSPALLHLCEEIESHFAVKGADEVAAADGPESCFQTLYLEFEKIESLQHMCRAQILNRLSAGNQRGESFQSMIEVLALPDSLKRYLLFDDRNSNDDDDLD